METGKIVGLDHIGIPSRNMDKTISFYEKLGFSVSLKTTNPNNHAQVAFLTLGNLVIESYEENDTSGTNGAIDHFSLSVTDVESLYNAALNEGYRIMTNGIERLPFWEKGVAFFKVMGPDGEEIEFLEKL